MIVECNNCHAKYNVDESKIPDTGIKVKCHKCQSIIFIEKEKASPEPIPPKPAPVSTPPPPEKPPEPSVQTPSAAPKVSDQHISSYGEVDLDRQPEVPTPEPPVPTEPEPAQPSAGVPVPEAKIEESPPAEPDTSFEPEPTAPPEPISTTPPAGELSEEDKKWHERARRLAKALASDLVLYNQDKVEQGLRDGTLAQLLGSEIRRSWEYYCQQIPKHIVDSTDHFKQQLNKIVGKGKEIFK